MQQQYLLFDNNIRHTCHFISNNLIGLTFIKLVIAPSVNCYNFITCLPSRRDHA